MADDFDDEEDYGGMHNADDGELVLNSDDGASDEEDRPDFDIRLPSEHQYLNSTYNQGNSTIVNPPNSSEPGSLLTVPTFLIPTVVLPGERLPIRCDGMNITFIKEAVDRQHSYIGVITIGPSERYMTNQGPYPITDTGVLVQITNMTEIEGGFSLIGTARQRFRLCRKLNISEVHELYGSSVVFALSVKVVVLDEILLGPIARDLTSSVNRLPIQFKTKYMASLCGLSSLVLHYSSTANIVRSLVRWLLSWHSEDRVNFFLDQGLAAFSFWVASNVAVHFERKLEFLVEDCVDRRLRLEWQSASRLSLLACMKCCDIKSSIKSLINLNSEGMGTHFVNPHGHIHELFTTKDFKNFTPVGQPEHNFSWFPGYAWRVMYCQCGAHLGWVFTSDVNKPQLFYGVLRDAIQPALEEPNEHF